MLVQRSKCIGEERKEKLWKYGLACLSEVVFAGLAAMGCAFGCSLAMQVKYGMSDLAYSGLASVVVGALVALIFLVYGLLWLKCSCYFEEYYNILNRKNAAEVILTWIYSYSGLTIALTSYMMHSYQYTTTLTIAYAFLLLIAFGFSNVYTKERDRVRVQLNLATIILTQSAYLVNTFWYDYSKANTSSLVAMATMAIPLALGLNLLLNCSFLAYESAKQVREWLAER